MQRHPLDQPLLGQSILGVPELTPLPGSDVGKEGAVRLLIVAADPVVRSAFGQRLGRVAVGQVSPDQVAAEVQRLSANVVLWDLGPAAVATEALSKMTVPVVALTSATGAAPRLLAGGASGVLRRDATAEAIQAALTAARQGLQVVDPSLAGAANDTRMGAVQAPTESLTPREIQVLELVATGMSNKQIARELGISAHTVKFHVNAILGKLDVHTRTQAVVRGVQLGLMTV